MSREQRFPWGYLAFALSPLLPVGSAFAFVLIFKSKDPEELPGLDLLIHAGIVSVILAVAAIAVGIVRLLCGGAREHPALRWLWLIPAAMAPSVLVLG